MNELLEIQDMARALVSRIEALSAQNVSGAPLPRDYIRRVANAVCDHFQIPRKQLFGNRRYGPQVWPRHLAWYAMTTCFELAQRDIAREFSRERSTISYGLLQARIRLDTIRSCRDDWEAVRKRLASL